MLIRATAVAAVTLFVGGCQPIAQLAEPPRLSRKAVAVQVHDGRHDFLDDFCRPVGAVDGVALGLGKTASARTARAKLRQRAEQAGVNHVSVRRALVTESGIGYQLEGLGYECEPLYRRRRQLEQDVVLVVPPFGELEPDEHKGELSLGLKTEVKPGHAPSLVTLMLNASAAPCLDRVQYPAGTFGPESESASDEVSCLFGGGRMWVMRYEDFVKAADNSTFAVTFGEGREAKFPIDGFKQLVKAASREADKAPEGAFPDVRSGS